MTQLPHISRRRVLQGSVATTLGLIAYPSLAVSSSSLVSFRSVPVAAGKGKVPAISPDYEYQVLIPWGEPLQPDGPAFSYPSTPGKQVEQVGIGHDGMVYFALGEDHGLMVINHEYGKNSHVLGKSSPDSYQDVLLSQYAHGMSIVEIEFRDGRWQTRPSGYARRIHANTPVRFSGPAAGHHLLLNRANNLFKGTLSNCSCGETPWGTYLTCEENFNFYFGGSGSFSPTSHQQRYGLHESGSDYGWYEFDPRFDLSNDDYANEANRFGWVMEVDPRDPAHVPVKRTALGRLKHESATTVEAPDGRLIVYMGDDSRDEFIYRYVSARPWREMREAGISPLDEGRLYVARFDVGGFGEWLHLHIEQERLRGSFSDQADVLVHARLAASLMGATPMDRPEWITVGRDGAIYCSLTNNNMRMSANAANPLVPNPHGHIIRFRDALAPANRSQGLAWEIFLMSADHYDSEHTLSSPDGLWADPDGRLFIETDGAQRDGMNNQLLVADIGGGDIRRLLTGVPGCEITGITTTPDRRTLFVNIQHPGGGDPAATNFPHATDGKTVPRDCTLAIRRKDGGIVGS
jgi:uncharacterized protein